MDEYEKKRGLSVLDSMGAIKYLLFALIAIILLLFFIWFTANNDNVENEIDEDGQIEQQQDEEEEDGETETEEIDTEEEEEALGGQDSIEVGEQEAGDSVLISEMELSESRWVVIHDNNDGELGNILGARLFSADATEGEVDLLRETEEGVTYYAVLYMVAEREENIGRRFDVSRDVPLVKEGGEIKKVPFSVSEE